MRSAERKECMLRKTLINVVDVVQKSHPTMSASLANAVEADAAAVAWHSRGTELGFRVLGLGPYLGFSV